MNEINKEEKSEIETFSELIFNELMEMKIHICNERYFEGGFVLGRLLCAVTYRQMEEIELRDKKNKEKNE